MYVELLTKFAAATLLARRWDLFSSKMENRVTNSISTSLGLGLAGEIVIPYDIKREGKRRERTKEGMNENL